MASYLANGAQLGWLLFRNSGLWRSGRRELILRRRW
jgi:hypothetical protein